MIVNLLTNPCCNRANRCQLCSSHQKKGSIKCETGKWEAVVTNDSIGTCSSDLYIDYFFETSGTASCGSTGIYIYMYMRIIWVQGGFGGWPPMETCRTFKQKRNNKKDGKKSNKKANKKQKDSNIFFGILR